MKKIVNMEIIKKEVVTFESLDGRIFNNQEDCEAWENSYKGTLYRDIKKIGMEENVDAFALHLPYWNEDSKVWLVYPTTLNDITLLNAYIDAEAGCSNGHISSDCINKVVALNWGYDGDYCDIWILEDLLNGITKDINKSIEDCLNKRILDNQVLLEQKES